MELDNIYAIDNTDDLLVKAVDLIDNSELKLIPFGFFLEGVVKYYSTYLMEYLKEINLTPRQIYILISLYNKDKIPQEYLASVLSSNEVTIAREVNFLENEGLILRTTDENDKRKKLVLLTEKGFELVKKLMLLYNESVDELLNYVNEEEFYILKLLLKKVYLALNDILNEKKGSD